MARNTTTTKKTTTTKAPAKKPALKSTSRSASVMTRSELLKKLRRNVMTITFRKVDGTNRIMKATLCADHIPTGKAKSLDTSGGSNREIINCFDTEANDYRTFQVDSVRKVA